MTGRKHSLLSSSCLPDMQGQTHLSMAAFSLTVDEGGWLCYSIQNRIMIEKFTYECYNIW